MKIISKAKTAVLSPAIIIAAGFACASAFQALVGEWAFVPLALFYWGATFAVAYKSLGKAAIAELFVKPQRSVLWTILCCAAGLIPLPILLLNLKLLESPAVAAIWLAFAVINPFFEEIYWRGFLLTSLPLSNAFSVVYSTLWFVASHPLMWGVFSIANRSWMTWLSLLLMGIAWSMAFLKTKSLRWCVLSHFFVDIFNLSVFVFLNLYVPPIM